MKAMIVMISLAMIGFQASAGKPKDNSGSNTPEQRQKEREREREEKAKGGAGERSDSAKKFASLLNNMGVARNSIDLLLENGEVRSLTIIEEGPNNTTSESSRRAVDVVSEISQNLGKPSMASIASRVSVGDVVDVVLAVSEGSSDSHKMGAKMVEMLAAVVKGQEGYTEAAVIDKVLTRFQSLADSLRQGVKISAAVDVALTRSATKKDEFRLCKLAKMKA